MTDDLTDPTRHDDSRSEQDRNDRTKVDRLWHHGRESQLRLIEEYCNGTLSDEDFRRLERVLLSDAEARSYFRRYLSLDTALREFGESASATWLAAERESTSGAGRAMSRRNRRRLISVVLACIVFTTTITVMIFDRRRADADVVGSLQQVIGDVRILAADGQARAIDADAPVRSGDTIRTRGTQSSTVMACRDGTRLTLVGDTSITWGDWRSKSLIVHQGTLAATVRAQSHHSPLLLATPSAQVQVLGTRFLIEALANRTDLSVSEGKVRLIRIRDGEAVDVTNGKHAVLTEQNELRVQDIPLASTHWEVDFEQGLPEEWSSGEWITDGLPSGSRGAVKSTRWVREDGGTSYGIRTQLAWMPGLFVVQPKSHLHFTFQVDTPEWVNIFLVTRTADTHEPRFSGNYLVKDFPKHSDGRWQSVTIPLSDFERIHRGEISVTEVVPYMLMFVHDPPDRRLVIDRIWITPDGPGEVQINDIK